MTELIPPVDTVTELIEPVEIAEPLTGADPADLPQPTRPLHTGRRRAVDPPRRGLSLTLCMAILLLAVAVSSRSWHEPSHPPTVAGPAANPGTSTPPPVDLSRPFAGTPAATWPDGPDGISVPAPAPIGRYSAAQVAQALTQVKQVLIAAHLDETMLLRHDPSTYLSLLAPNTRAQERAAITGTRDPDEGGEVTLIAPGFALLPVPVKVNGSMSVTIDRHGLLLIHTNVVYAYPFAPSRDAKITKPWQIVAVQHVAEDFTVVGGSAYAAGDRGLWVTSSKAYYDSMACTASEHGYLAPAYSDPGHAPAQADPNGLYDPNHPLSIAGTC